MQRKVLSLLILYSCVAIVPLVPSRQGPEQGRVAFPGWPQEFNGAPLQRLPLSDREQQLTADFPGTVARFTDGERELIMRWVARPTRQLHSVADCLRGAGYRVTALPLRDEGNGEHWGCRSAVRGAEHLRVCERIFDEYGGSWSDPSSWFWAALSRQTTGPWWSATIAESLEGRSA